MRKTTGLLGILLTLAIAGCAETPTDRAYKKAERIATDPGKVAALLGDRTVKGYDGHGTQIEYLAPNGRTALWYPGNRTVLPGAWQLRGGALPRICFRYGADTYNPLTGTQGAGWDCGDLAGYLADRDEVVAGDPLRLRQRLPFVMPARTDMSIAQAMAQAGLGPLKARNEAFAPRLPGQAAQDPQP